MIDIETRNLIDAIIYNFINSNFVNGFNKKDYKKGLIEEIVKEILIKRIDTDEYIIETNRIISGRYYDKIQDIIIIKKSEYREDAFQNIISGVEEVINVIAPIYSMKKNIVFFLEETLAESENLSNKGIEYTVFLFLPNRVPIFGEYISENNRQIIGYEEVSIDDKEINSLINLFIEEKITNLVLFYYQISIYKDFFNNTYELKDKETNIFVENNEIVSSKDYDLSEYLDIFYNTYNY